MRESEKKEKKGKNVDAGFSKRWIQTHAKWFKWKLSIFVKNFVS